MADKIFSEETKKLISVISLVKGAKISLEKAMESLGAFNLDRLKELRENPTTNAADFQQFLNMLDTKNAVFNVPDKYKKLEELEYLSKEPYFSRIDLVNTENQDIKSHYIGKFGYSDEKDPIIIDWRAKVASVYYKYRYPQKNVSFDSPKGVVTRDLKLKRTFEIDNGELLKYYNNDLKLDENEIIADKISDRTGGVLEDIIETIQKGQHEIIEADPRSVCIVQGTVGSGKSTVAIHKLSYIFFNFPEIVRPQRSILIAKSQILVGYLSTLFPKLGIFDINYGTIRDVLYKILFAEKISSDFDLGLNTDIAEFDITKVRELNLKVDEVHKDLSNQLDAVFNSEETESFGGYVYDKSLPARQNFTEAIQDLEEEKKYQLEFVKENSNHPRVKLFQTNIKVMRKIIRKLSAIRSSIRTDKISKLAKTYKLRDSGDFGYLQALIYIYIYAELIGFKKFEQYEYCVIDEGQDFSALEYFVLNKLVSHGRFCILGDLNQSYSDEGLSEWEEIYEVVTGSKNAHKFVLETNYRSTKAIIDYANTILSPYTDKYLPLPINREGPKPSLSGFPEKESLLASFKKELKGDLTNFDKSIGIICMDDIYYQEVDKILSKLNIPKDKLVKLKETDRATYLPRAVYFTHFDNCKGLEFGKVYVMGLNPSKIKSFKDAKRAFVAVTRAMNVVSIYYEEA